MWTKGGSGALADVVDAAFAVTDPSTDPNPSADPSADTDPNANANPNANPD